MKGIGRGLFSGLLIAVMAVAMACGGSSDSGGGGGDPLAPSGGNSSSGGSAKGDLRLIGGDPLTMDPAQASDSGSAAYIVEIFGGLVTLDQNLKIVPDLAESWDVTNDGKTYTFKIRNMNV